MDNYSSIGFNIFLIDKYFKLFFKLEMAKHDLNVAEGMVLLSMFGKNCPFNYDGRPFGGDGLAKTQEQLVSELHYDKSVIARTMASLQEKGFVTREVDHEDKRSYIYSLTDFANDFKPDLINILRDWNNILIRNVEGIAQTDVSVSQIAKNVKEYFQNIDKK